MEKIGLVQIMKDFLDENRRWPRFTYGDMCGSSMVYVYHNGIILAFLSDVNVVVRGKGYYFAYCGSKISMFDRYIPEDPDFIPKVSNAVDIGIRLIEDGKPWYPLDS